MGGPGPPDAARRSARLHAATRLDALRRDEQGAPARRVVAVAGDRPRIGSERRRRARPLPVHGGHGVAARGHARGVPGSRPRQLRAEPRGRPPRRPFAARAAGRVHERVGHERAATRGDPLAAGHQARRDHGAAHQRDPGCPSRARHLDARCVARARRLGEPRCCARRPGHRSSERSGRCPQSSSTAYPTPP